MKKLKAWVIVFILVITYTICPMMRSYASELDTQQNSSTESEDQQNNDSQDPKIQNEATNTNQPQTDDSQTNDSNTEQGAKTTDNTALFDSAGVSISAPSAILMESSTGTIIYEKNSKESLRPASITKIMTLILIFDALAAGKISLEDTVTVSDYAASMGGSQVFFEPGETQTVDTMIKCIAVASANDACGAY